MIVAISRFRPPAEHAERLVARFQVAKAASGADDSTFAMYEVVGQ